MNTFNLNNLESEYVKKPLIFENIDYIESFSDLESVVPILNTFYLSPTTIEIPKIDIDILMNFLNKIFYDFPKMDIIRKNNFTYLFEYFPIENLKINLCQEKLHKIKYFCSLQAVAKAYKVLPHLDDYFDNDISYGLLNNKVSLNDWFKAEVKLYFDDKKNCYLLEVKRILGCAISFYNNFYDNIKNLLNKNNLYWLKRKDYIILFEGIGFTKKCDHISNYLLNEYICREICSF